MQIDSQTFLRLVEDSRKLCFLDIEATGLRGDYNSTLVVSVKPYGAMPVSFHVLQPGNDKKVVREAKEYLEKFLCWCTYFGKGFDVKFLNTRLTKWGYPPISPRPHIDMYFTLKYHLLTARKSQAHLLRLFGCEQQKMDLSPDMWNQVLEDPVKNMETMVARCESDTAGLEALYRKTCHLIRDVKS